MKTPSTVAEIADIIRSSKRVLAVGAQTKPRLSQVPDEVTLVSMRNLSGIVEYDPGEFTFTAFAGTPLREIVATLAAQGQYLPFDPPLVESGATIGGTVAAGLSGPGRFRYGGLRDFILAVRFLDGNGTQLRGGAKVVKNAAGFDIPKFLVGSLGRFGVLTEVTFKVFPCPPAMMTFAIPCANAAEAAAHIAKSASGRWEFDALDYDATRILARIRGPQVALDLIGEDIVLHWPNARQIANDVWAQINEWRFAASAAVLLKIPATIYQLESIDSLLRARDFQYHVSGGGSFVLAHRSTIPAPETLNSALAAADLKALVMIGESARRQLGKERRTDVGIALKNAFDPGDRLY